MYIEILMNTFEAYKTHYSSIQWELQKISQGQPSFINVLE
jgi:hypothetical protein